MNLSKPFNVSICVLALLLVSPASFCQNMNSPYSIYGVGDINDGVSNRTSGMGGTGMATKSFTDIINNNPAAISGLPRSFLIVNAAGVGKAVSYSGTGIDATNRNNKDFWITGLNLAIKINKYWASGIGFKQFSNVNYNFSGIKNVIGSNDTYAAQYSGAGGLNDFYWTNAFSLGKHFSIGVKSSIIAGGINQDEVIVNAVTANTIDTKQQDYYGDPRFEYGAIYSTALGKKWDFSIGGKYISKTRLNSERSLTITENSTNILVNNETLQNGKFYLPQTYSMGLSLVHNKRVTFAADYSHEDWTPLNVGGEGWHLINTDRLSAGVEVAQLFQKWGLTIEKRYLQFGAFIDNSYLQVNDRPLNEFGITAGIGGTFSNNLLYMFSLQGGKRGTSTNGLLRENFYGVTISLTYRDFLLSKGRKYD